MRDWSTLRPEQISQEMNFELATPAWQYQPGHVSMANKQAEGVAYLCRLLEREGLALLADEVGMGKTFQALGVMHLLWQAKPEARVLVMAPNKSICRHWQNEHQQFLQEHCRPPVPADTAAAGAATICGNLAALCEQVRDPDKRFFLVTTHSLSMLGDGNVEGGDAGAGNSEDPAVRAKRIADGMRLDIHAALPGGFDLLVIDEAHYFRNIHGGSQRVAAGEGFFGKAAAPLARKALLLTATPSHKGMQDVRNILGFFKDIAPQPAPELLRRYALRRLRLMPTQDNNYVTKHSYRRELAVPASFGANSLSELFFAFYQKRLGKKMGRKILYGYLEGFESLGAATLPEAQAAGGDTSSKDFHKAPDSELLSAMSAEFHGLFGRLPDHPKYDATIAKLVPRALRDSDVPLHHNKHLVFVRRIPSVRELTQRVNRAYDELYIPLLLQAWGLKANDPVAQNWKASNWSRSGFAALTREVTERYSKRGEQLEAPPALDDAGGEQPAAPHDDRLGSVVANLFVVKRNAGKEDGQDGGKEGGSERTDCANVRLRFRKPESVFSLFLEPAADYRSAGYSACYDSIDGHKSLYATAARDTRLHRHKLAGEPQPPEHYVPAQITPTTQELETAWGLIHPLLTDSEREILDGWRCRIGVAENFANYLREGFLQASPVMVELYCWFTAFRLEQWKNQGKEKTRSYDHASAPERYRMFVEYAKLRMPGSLMLAYFREALPSFETLCKKIAGYKPADYKKKWTVLTQMHNPAWYASGASGDRDRLIIGFNSPFFPNVLVATSVFQEGVNLHLQCRQVHHYGIAWTPGDNEQRVGRVDRLFGRVYKELAQPGSTTLDIHFPYLERSFDEDQVGSFVRHKHGVEAAMDFCLQDAFDKAIDTTLAPGEWKQYLRTPASGAGQRPDPYGAHF
ncbi:DEAD/DEAH box helicase [Pseudoduganella aquatica]|uniref:DEAD/DEAH box helicase family protein n=1 Tax=Pseudoduganella aquatica TaxID=2660641 RepID=A0A7X4KPX1_9BURK|nr:DEAD/DEAH box helicase [Pseudoduganella aquatica]MYN09701.1 DEAD/DEAH box helicase family protein [Pseudoduganella aquatica]